jgi:hypothetical protein
MGGGSRLRSAVGLSAGLHLLLAAGLVLLGRWQARRPAEPPPRPGIETRVVDVTVRLIEPEPSPPVEVPTPEPPAGEPGDASPPPAEAPEPSAEPVAETGGSRPPPAEHQERETSRPPLARAVPRPLPPELITLMRKPPAPAVVEVPLDLPAIGPVRPAAAVGPAKPAAHPLDGGSPVHGAMAAGRTVVYVLDASGSMGEFGKFDLARKALAATLRRQPEAVRLQVVVYAGRAVVPLPAPESRCVPATAQNVARVADVLAALPHPSGRSDHAGGLRAALDLRPDVVVFLTDADGPPPAAFRELVRRADPRPAVCVARVAPGGVARPADWK